MVISGTNMQENCMRFLIGSTLKLENNAENAGSITLIPTKSSNYRLIKWIMDA